jgi:hypothetical protein
MEKKLCFILMADIVDSSNIPQQKNLMADFKKIVQTINDTAEQQIISPITITLGDEFQSVISNLGASLEIIMAIEELIVARNLDFKLRFVLVQGEIDTDINSKIAYEMLGSGLTNARSYLSEMKNSNERFRIKLADKQHSDAINNAFIVYQHIVDGWQVEKDYYIVSKFLEFLDYKQVAVALNKDKSLMWRREKTAKIKEYLALKNVINFLGDCHYV